MLCLEIYCYISIHCDVLTGVHVGAKCECAILYVEGKAEDLQVTC